MQRSTKATVNRSTRPTTAQAGNKSVSHQARSAGSQINKAASNAARGAVNESNITGQAKVIVCRKCKSPQVVANKRGYSFAKMFATFGIMVLVGILLIFLSIFLSGLGLLNGDGASSVLYMASGIMGFICLFFSILVSILVGFVGRSNIVNGCMNCGFKWTPAKKK